MSQFYTKEQIDQIAGIIGTEIKSTRSSAPTVAKDFTSFVTALDQAISTSDGNLLENPYVVIGDPVGLRNFEYVMEVNGNICNMMGEDLLDFWTLNRVEYPGLIGDLSITQDPESNGMSFSNDNTITPITVKIISSYETNFDNYFVIGQGVTTQNSFEFTLAPSTMNMT